MGIPHRKSANGRGYKKSFTSNARRTHVKNLTAGSPRGGIRL